MPPRFLPRFPTGLLRLRWPAVATDAAPPPSPDLPRPDPPVCVVGDVHGRLDLLERMLDLVAARRAAPGGAAARLVFAGDLIDRGPDSAAVLARVMAMVAASGGATRAVMGNHERMLLDFLDAPAVAGPVWLGNGGDATLASFGINPHRAGDPGARAAALRAALPAGMEAWLRGLPLYWRAGDLAVCHAGADPARPIETQAAAALLWGHRDFRRRPRSDGLWIAHGHVIAPQVRAEHGRIGIDTGAFATGRLSAAWFGPDGLEVIEARTD